MEMKRPVETVPRMLNLVFKTHRQVLRAGTTEPQKVFVMVRAMPTKSAIPLRAPLALALVIDTSGSMHNAGPLPKIERAIAAAHNLMNDPALGPDDHVTVVSFDDRARTLLALSPLGDKRAVHDAIEQLRRQGGRTYLAQGLQQAAQQLAQVPQQTPKRLLLLTDGQAHDADNGVAGAQHLAQMNVPIIAIGVGAEYNEHLLRDLAGVSQGRPYHLEDLTQLVSLLQWEVQSAGREVVTDVRVAVDTVQGIELDSAARVYPSLAEIDTVQRPLRLGNLTAGDETVFILEFTVSGLSRPPSRARLARLNWMARAADSGDNLDLPSQDLIISFTTDESGVNEVDMEVLGYVQQKNVDRLVQDAMQQAPTSGENARQSLQSALSMTRRIGNVAVTHMIENALGELARTGTLSSSARKSVALGNRTRTVKIGSSGKGDPGSPSLVGNVPSEDDIRRLTGA